jgi:hypothetical protein
MPNGVYPVPRFRASTADGAHSWRVRLSAWWHRAELDHQLAAGADPVHGTPLHLRAEQLSSRAERVQLARAFEDVLREARRRPPVSGVREPLRRREIRECDEDILALAHRLEDERAIDVQGAAMATLLLSDPSGPLCRAGDVTLRFAVRSARLALDHVDEAAPALPEAA